MANFYKKSNQLGRSMIEMLGVLAIIGVLSIAGIAGYTKAMEKWRINKAVQQIATTVAAIRTKFINEKNYNFLQQYHSNGKKLLDLGIISADMLSDTSIVGNDNVGTDIVNPFKGGYWISGDDIGYKTFIIAMSGLHRNECMALATNDWSELGVNNLNLNGNDGDNSGWTAECFGEWSNSDRIEGDIITACPNGKTVPIPIPAHIAAQACSHCNNYNAGCSMILGFHD